MILSRCSAPGCSNLTPNTRCAKHPQDTRQQYDKARQSDPLRRIYNTAIWRRIRIFVLGRDPLCKIAKLCVERDGHPAPSEVVDHIQSMRSGGDAYDTDNLQGSCKACHDHKTATEDSTFARRNE
jgi:5-methylcytosine-specific restriction protein A